MIRLHSIVGRIKAFSARTINDQLRHRATLWQEESFDHVLRSSENLDAKIAYVLQNPVRAGLVRIAEEYPWTWVRQSERAWTPAPTRSILG